MLNLSRKTLLAIEAVVDIAVHARPDPVQSRDITRRQGIAQRSLEPVMQELVHAGILRGVRGPKGGYILARERRRITLGDIVRIVDGLERTGEPDRTDSPLREAIIAPAWQEAEDAMLEKLDATTVAALADAAKAAGVANDASPRPLTRLHDMTAAAHRPLRILLVANFDRRRAQARWFNTEQKLLNGFVRLGHLALPFSDRDAARELSPLPTKKLGIPAMRRRLVETATHFSPHLVLVGHADTLRAEDFADLRRTVPGVRLAQFNVDPTHRPKTMAAFTERARHVDTSFITTGDPAALAPLSPYPGAIRFMPNPVDAAVETARVFEATRERLQWDALFLGTGIERRGEQLSHIERNLPEDVRFHYDGRVKGAEPLVSTPFLDALTTGASCPNLPLDDTRATPLLYSSDRIAQLLGQGVLAYTHAPAGLDALYGEGVVPWQNRDALVEAMARMARDDDARRKIAETGWRIAHATTSSEQVAAAIVEAAMDWPARRTYAWPTDPLA